MEDHHYLPSTTPNETEAWARRGSGPCRIMQKSHSMEIHHYIPNFEDLYFSHVEGCKITQKNRPVKDYRYVYPLLLVGEKSDTIEVSELKEMQFSLSYMHHFTEGYQYIFPSFDSLSHRQQTIEGLKQKFDITILSTPKGHEVCKGYKYVYSVCDDLCSLVIPDDIEEVLRCGPVDNIWLTADRKEMVIQIANGKLLQLPTHTLTSEQLHEELEGKTLLPGIAGGKHAVKLIESQRQNLKNKKGSSSLSSQKLTSSAKKKNTPVDVDMGLNIANGYSSPSSIPTEGESLSHSDSNSDILSLDPEDWHSACTSVSPTCALESYCEHKAENGTALLSSFDGTIRNVVNSVEAETVERHLNGDIVNKRSISCGSSSNSSFERNEDQLSGLSGSDLVGVVKPHQEKTINEDTTVECKEVVSSSLFGDILAISGKSEMNLNEEHSPMKQHPVDLSEVRNLCQSSVDVRNKCLSEAEMLQRNVMDHLRASDGVNINLDPTRFSSYSEGRRESGTNLLQSNVNAKGHLTSLNENMSEFTDVDGLATNEINHEKIFELTTTNSNNEVMDQLFSLQGSTVKSSSMMSAVSRSRRLQFFPHETSSNNETAMFVTKNGDLLLGDQQQSKMGNALFKVLSSEDESEKEMITEDEHSLRLHNSDSGQDTPQLQITECLSDSHEEEQQSLQIKEENGHGDKKVHGSSLSNILQDTNIEDKGLPTGRHLTSCEVNDDRNEDSITTNAISKRKSLDEMGDKSDDESLTSRPSSRSDTSPSTLDPVEQLASSMRAAGYTQALHSRDVGTVVISNMIFNLLSCVNGFCDFGYHFIPL